MKFGVIFDWDGVVIDSRRQHEKSWDRLAAEEKLDLPEGHFLKGFGMKNNRIIPHVLGWTEDLDEVARLAARKEELYREIIQEDGIGPLPGVREFLETLRQEKIPCAIGSSTERKNIEVILEVIGLGDFFSVIVSADDATHGKPHPEIFLNAAKKLNLPPEQCIVIEDTQVGVDAAHAGGMKVIAVTTTHPRDTFNNTDRIVDRLDELAIDELRALVDR